MSGRLTFGLVLVIGVALLGFSCTSSIVPGNVPGDFLGMVKSVKGGEGGMARIELFKESAGVITPGMAIFSWSGGENPSIGKLVVESVKGDICNATVVRYGMRPIRRGDAVFAVLAVDASGLEK